MPPLFDDPLELFPSPRPPDWLIGRDETVELSDGGGSEVADVLVVRNRGRLGRTRIATTDETRGDHDQAE
ncbi:MAG: hypothetical protein R3B96_10410 [Pirellulaceae bacterium]